MSLWSYFFGKRDVWTVQVASKPDAAGEWRWNCKAGNGEITQQGEGYTRREDAERAAKRLTEVRLVFKE